MRRISANAAGRRTVAGDLPTPATALRSDPLVTGPDGTAAVSEWRGCGGTVEQSLQSGAVTGVGASRSVSDCAYPELVLY
jgi:hypothetical protein